MISLFVIYFGLWNCFNIRCADFVNMEGFYEVDQDDIDLS